jgi:anti-sigma factor RsiW
MHDVVMNEFEKHLSGNASEAFYSHLEICPECRAEVAAMDEVSLFVRELRLNPGLSGETAPQPPLGFYNRVTGTIVERQQKEAWGLFSPGAAFFRRIAFVSLLLMAALGSFLVTRESGQGGTDAAAIMAQHEGSGHNSGSNETDRLLVTLATYGE